MKKQKMIPKRIADTIERLKRPQIALLLLMRPGKWHFELYLRQFVWGLNFSLIDDLTHALGTELLVLTCEPDGRQHPRLGRSWRWR